MAMTARRISRRWLVLAGAFIAVFLELGTMKSFGLFIKDMTRDLQTTTAMLGLAVGLFHGFSLILGIFNIPMMKKFSAWQLIMVGSLIGSLGLIFSAFSKSGPHFIYAMCISGAGYSIVIFPSHTCSTLDYFPDAFEKAVSVTLTGGGLGMMLLPLFAELLHEAYGWRGAVIILGALNLNYIVVGALMKPVEKQKPERTETTGVVEGNISKEGYVEVMQEPTYESNVEQQIPVILTKPIEIEESIILTDKENLESDNRKKGEVSKTSKDVQLKNIRPIIQNEFIDRGESTNTFDNDENETVTYSGENHRSATQCSIYKFLKKLFDLGLFIENPTFIFPVLVYFLFGITYASWIVFVIPNAVAKGYTTGEGAFLATTGGAANIVGRFATGFISSRDFCREEISCCLMCLTAATAFFCNTFASSFWSLAVLSMMNGFAGGAKIVMDSLIAKKSLSLDLVSTGMCYLFFSKGVGEPVGGAIMGLFYDQTSSYVLAFNVAALIEFLSALIILFPLLRRRLKSETH